MVVVQGNNCRGKMGVVSRGGVEKMKQATIMTVTLKVYLTQVHAGEQLQRQNPTCLTARLSFLAGKERHHKVDRKNKSTEKIKQASNSLLRHYI